MDEQQILQAIRAILKEELKTELQPINKRLDSMDAKMDSMDKNIKEIKGMIEDIDPKNANRHLELNDKIDSIQSDVRFLKENLQKVEVVTGKNCIEIEYLKSVK